MHTGQNPLHYTPTSVGALMDPEYLRGAVLDATGDHHANSDPRQTLSGRLQPALLAIRAAFERFRQH